ncbi:hypothetical protein JCM5353_006576 [Sporobolomyces roseus]
MTSTTTQNEYVPTSLMDHTLRTAPLKVIYGTLTFTSRSSQYERVAALGGIVGAGSGVARGLPAIPASFKTSINTGVFSFTFFSIREYALLPLLTQFHLHPSPLTPNSSLSLSPHTANFLPTTLSGLISGTLFSYFQRPTSPSLQHIRGGLTLGLGCLILQSLTNESDLIRIKLLQRSEERRLNPPAPPTISSTLPHSDSPPLEKRPTLLSPLPPSAPSNSHHFSDPTSLTFSERSDALISSAWERTKNAVKGLMPLKRIEEGVFEERLEGALQGKREELREMREERRRLEDVLKGRN